MVVKSLLTSDDIKLYINEIVSDAEEFMKDYYTISSISRILKKPYYKIQEIARTLNPKVVKSRKYYSLHEVVLQLRRKGEHVHATIRK